MQANILSMLGITYKTGNSNYLCTACKINNLRRKKWHSLKFWHWFSNTYYSIATKDQNICSRESKVTPFTPRVSVSFEEGIFGPKMNFPYNLIEKILQIWITFDSLDQIFWFFCGSLHKYVENKTKLSEDAIFFSSSFHFLNLCPLFWKNCSFIYI